jgi:CMP-N,N'-diacetyllegionaminic acid synthase
VRRLCTICARGGSKGVPGKNVWVVAGKPLIVYSIEQAKASELFDLVAISSDSDEILDVAHRSGADILVHRPGELATDTAPKMPVIQHAARTVEDRIGAKFDVFVDLDATSPLRLPADIVGAVRLLEDSGVSQVITGMPARRSPYFNLVELDEVGQVRLAKQGDEPFVRRQDTPLCFDMNSSIYVWTRPGLFGWGYPFNPDTRLFMMPDERSIDIDSELDALFVKFLLERRNSSEELIATVPRFVHT